MRTQEIEDENGKWRMKVQVLTTNNDERRMKDDELKGENDQYRMKMQVLAAKTEK